MNNSSTELLECKVIFLRAQCIVLAKTQLHVSLISLGNTVSVTSYFHFYLLITESIFAVLLILLMIQTAWSAWFCSCLILSIYMYIHVRELDVHVKTKKERKNISYFKVSWCMNAHKYTSNMYIVHSRAGLAGKILLWPNGKCLHFVY